MTLAPLSLRVALGRDALVTIEEAASLTGQTIDRVRELTLSLPRVQRTRGGVLLRYGTLLDRVEVLPAPPARPEEVPAPLDPRPLRMPVSRARRDQW